MLCAFRIMPALLVLHMSPPPVPHPTAFVAIAAHAALGLGGSMPFGLTAGLGLGNIAIIVSVSGK